MNRLALPRTGRTLPRIAGCAGALTALLALAACGESTSGTGNSGGSTLNETAVDFSYGTTSFSVQPGASVTVDFKNNGSTTHSFTLDNGGGETQAAPGSSNSFTFTAPQSGTLTFHCKFHPTQMMGTIAVSGSGGAGAGGGASSSSSSSSSSTNSGGGGYGY